MGKDVEHGRVSVYTRTHMVERADPEMRQADLLLLLLRERMCELCARHMDGLHVARER